MEYINEMVKNWLFFMEDSIKNVLNSVRASASLI